jgi:zinc transport system substrate-binding protein
MKYFKIVVALMLGLALGLSACGEAAAPPGDERLTVYASFYTMYDLATKIAGAEAQVILLAPSGAEPHEWEPSAADLAGLTQADLFIYNGLGMEPWAERVLASLPDTVLTLEASAGITPLQQEGINDPHVWLYPLYARAEMESIAQALTLADPDHAAQYAANWAIYREKCTVLDQDFQQALAEFAGRSIIVTHPAFAYLCAAYGLEQVAVAGIAAEAEPTPGQMAAIIDFAVSSGARAVFYEDLDNPRLAQAIAADAGIEARPLSTLEGLTVPQQVAGGDYFSLMTANLQALQEALRE